MPQIWATYDELAEHFGRTPAETRDAVIAAAWPRRQCSDGQTRVKLTPTLGVELTRAYIRSVDGGGSTTDLPIASDAAATAAVTPASPSPDLARLQAELNQIRSVLSSALLDLAAERERTATLSSELLRLTVQQADWQAEPARRVA
ncbi:hypothetical protein GCM10007036_18300 [Alsobacter metallidurans]|uniref:Uncharacterized protein n=1 Tax=Alsobacter metallidurans TaxID=340221 RepID=A0A917I6R2_9HYPH|nr:hypothetical protein [Alsobacter metallidurans]GGH17096.1 hypothetical protein GCM10007036_18300 [Alsobacter metallidurans]